MTLRALILGSGSNTGASLIQKLQSEGYTSATFVQNPDDFLADISPEAISQELAVNTVSLYAAVQAAVEGWDGLGKDEVDGGPRTLIYTENPLPWTNLPKFVSLAMGKSASATLVESLAATYGAGGKRFYFTMQVDEETGGLYDGIDGPAAAQVYWDLIQREEQGGWKISFDEKLKLWES
ncbi:hypothetical protein C7212DRAFT_355386 [Tuber magnatum]|uniref:NAD(P)-binding protein n=1 Tax=Tuber magnatum TaxID=42249 RepID=A0A317T1U8_9PEZI|nr:hypothetical protein C7212DRAFT_355386 [Tuber magnatum]